MTVAFWIQAGLAALVLAVGVFTVAVRHTFAAVVGFVGFGLLLALSWVSLNAIDVALTEAAIGGALTGVLLIGAAGRLRATESAVRVERPALPLRAFAAVLSAALAAAIAFAVLSLPVPAPTLAPAVAEHMTVTGLGNPVTAVLLAFRGTDTLLEAIVLVFALVGVWSFSPDRGWGGRPHPLVVPDSGGVLAFGARVIVPLGIVIGLYIFWVGADHPGGKFQAATILAAMWLLMVMAGLAEMPRIERRWVRLIAAGGPLAFIVVGFAGIATAGAFLAYPEAHAKALIIAVEAALVPSIALILGLLLAGSPAGTERR